MTLLVRKLKRKDGASLLMAVLLLLFGVVVSVVTVTAAVSASRSVRADRLQRQAYLTVSSAALLVQSQLDGLSYTFTEIDGVPVADDGGIAGAPQWTTVLHGLAERVGRYGAGAEETVTVSTEGLATVQVNLRMEPDYSLNVLFSLQNGDPVQHRIQLLLDGSTQKTSGVAAGQTVTTTRISWSNSRVRKP